jgi:hypothetical protein
VAPARVGVGVGVGVAIVGAVVGYAGRVIRV